MAAIELIGRVEIILLGGRWAGKSSSGNTVLGLQGPESFSIGRQTEVCIRKEKDVCGIRVTVVDTPSWNWVPAEDTSEEVKAQLTGSTALTEGGAPAFLLVYPLGSPFVGRHKLAVEQHLQLLGPEVWRHTAILFSRGDWLEGRGTTIEEHLKGASTELRWLLDACGQRYHVLNNKDTGDRAQVSKLLQMIGEMLGTSGERRALEAEDMLFKREEMLVKREHMVAKREGLIRSREEVIGKREEMMREREEMLEKREEMQRKIEEMSVIRKRKLSLSEPPATSPDAPRVEHQRRRDEEGDGDTRGAEGSREREDIVDLVEET
ncbi:GTPase IMAP family member GIMD1-like [Aplochiton taeniatus]